MSYGCHYCASNEEEIEKFAATLPADSTFEVIHITGENNGLAVFAPVFATLEVMGIERQTRDQAFNAVMTRGINLADEEALNGWLKKNSIDVDKYHQLRQSQPLPSVWNIWRKSPNFMTLTRRRCLLLIKNT
jgi:thiol:disulfide interchange protein DsbA